MIRANVNRKHMVNGVLVAIFIPIKQRSTSFQQTRMIFTMSKTHIFNKHASKDVYTSSLLLSPFICSNLKGNSAMINCQQLHCQSCYTFDNVEWNLQSTNLINIFSIFGKKYTWKVHAFSFANGIICKERRYTVEGINYKLMI